MLLVASSNMMMELWRRSARAKAISCRCPWEKLVPPGDILVARLMVVFVSNSVLVATDDESVVRAAFTASKGVRDEGASSAEIGCSSEIRCTRLSTFIQSLSSYSSFKEIGILQLKISDSWDLLNGSRLSRRVPENNVASCDNGSEMGQIGTEIYRYLRNEGLHGILVRRSSQWTDLRTTFERRSWVPIVEMSIPSISIRPTVGST